MRKEVNLVNNYLLHAASIGKEVFITLDKEKNIRTSLDHFDDVVGVRTIVI